MMPEVFSLFTYFFDFVTNPWPHDHIQAFRNSVRDANVFEDSDLLHYFFHSFLRQYSYHTDCISTLR